MAVVRSPEFHFWASINRWAGLSSLWMVYESSIGKGTGIWRDLQ